MKCNQQTSTECLYFLLKLMTSGNKNIKITSNGIIIRNLDIFKKSLPTGTSIYNFIKLLNVRGINAIISKTKLIIYTNSSLANAIMHKFLDEMEYEQEKIINSIARKTECLRCAIESNRVLKKMLNERYVPT